jgi:hypothetical protein
VTAGPLTGLRFCPQLAPFRALDWTTGTVDCRPAEVPEVTYWGTFDGAFPLPLRLESSHPRRCAAVSNTHMHRAEVLKEICSGF